MIAISTINNLTFYDKETNKPVFTIEESFPMEGQLEIPDEEAEQVINRIVEMERFKNEI